MGSYLTGKRICVTGGAGFLGRAVCARLEEHDPAEIIVPRKADFDLTGADSVGRMYDQAKPDIVIHLAAEVGGIGANQQHPGRFFYANLAMGLHLIEEARQRSIDKFVQVGTVCAYPKFCPVPFREDDLWNGYPEETNAPYGIAKRALSVMLD
ncbi:MAG: NAD-dependent epimerase/dehydratase family protein, partial [Planctomycetes bacterium]|nr:NAD-dependent epimerase/dehydratase family protein [Planctomycetota bacterium]